MKKGFVHQRYVHADDADIILFFCMLYGHTTQSWSICSLMIIKQPGVFIYLYLKHRSVMPEQACGVKLPP